jgi:uncharacterized protein YjbI with pentapeptide repeats
MTKLNFCTNANYPVKQFSSESHNPKKLLFNAGLLMSILVGRKLPQQDDSENLLTLVFSGQIAGFITNLDFSTLQTLADSCLGDNAGVLLDLVRKNFEIVTVKKKCVEKAAKYPFNQFNTAISLACAEEEGIDFIITESPEAFIGGSEVLICVPEEFISRYFYETGEVIDSGKIPPCISPPIPGSARINLLPEENLREIFEGWYIEHFEVHITATEAARAELSLWNKADGRKVTRYAYGNGPADALFRALALAVFVAEPTYYLPLPIINHIFLESEQLGSDSPVNAKITVEVEGEFYTGSFVSTDTVKAVFYAYLAAISELRLNKKSPQEIVTSEKLRAQYQDGKRHFSEVTLTNLSLSDLHLEGIDLEGSSITASDLRRTVFSCQEHNANLKKAKIDLSALDNADFSYADLNDVEIVATKMVGTIFYHADLSDSMIRGSELNKAKLNEAKLARATLIASSLKGAELNHACLDQAILSGVDLTEATLQIASLIRAVLNNACLNRAILTKADLTGANFSRAKLVSADLRGSTATESTFSYAKLTNADLTRTNFSGAKFISADLKGAIVLETTFSYADLSKANLEGLDLTKADLTKAVLDHANLDKTKLTRNQVYQLGGYPENVNLNQAIIEASPSSNSPDLPECCLGLS